MAKYTQEDLELAYKAVRNTTACTDKVAELVATVRHEAYERAAKECEASYRESPDYVKHDLAERIRGLK